MAKKNTKAEVIERLQSAEADAVSPFAETVNESPVEARAPRVFKLGKPAPHIEAAVEAAPVKRVRKVKAAVAKDPFADIAGSSPVKKEAKKRVPASKKARKAVPKKSTVVLAGTKTVDVPNFTAVEVITPSVTVTETIPEPAVELSAAFKVLAEVSLPPLKKDNRARLVLQSPTRAYFYWSIRQNPWQQLRHVFGDASNSYTLIVKLTDVASGSEELHRAEPVGEHWFDVSPDRKYEAEIGFYAPNRPYFRILYSNQIETPRRSPSPHPATDSQWAVSANKFAELLDVSGFTRDAVDVAIAGDDHQGAAEATHLAFSSFVGGGDFSEVPAEDLRYALLSVAAGVTVADLRTRVSSRIYSAIENRPGEPSAAASRAVLKEYFNIDQAEWTEEELGPAVHGASLLHFPKTLRPRKVGSTFAPRYNPVSSHSIG